MHLTNLTSAVVLATIAFTSASILPQHQDTLHTESPEDNPSAVRNDLALAVRDTNHPPFSTDNTCGKRANGKGKGLSCNPLGLGGGPCCSQFGNCGKTPSYCGKGCQKEFGMCHGLSPSKTSTRTLQPYPTQPANSTRCGPAANNAICPNNQCCSATGYCGSTILHCESPDCLAAFGRCDSETIPHGVNTSVDARPFLGQIPYGPVIRSCTKPGVIALTYDDGPSEYTSKLLDRLKHHGFKATFFITANSNGKGEIDITSKWTAVIRRMLAEGHQIGSHTWSHANLSALTSWQRKDEIYKNERAIANIIGKYPTYMRSPYTECTEASGCPADIKSLGYHRVGFDVSTDDWRHPKAEQIQLAKNRVTAALAPRKADGNALVIQHDIIPQSVNNLTEFIIAEAVKKGWKGVTVGECLGDHVKNWYRIPTTKEPAGVGSPSCIVSQGPFCGHIQKFSDRNECFASNSDCYREVTQCQGFLHDLPGGPTTCDTFKKMCEVQTFFCINCGKTGQGECNSKSLTIGH